MKHHYLTCRRIQAPVNKLKNRSWILECSHTRLSSTNSSLNSSFVKPSPQFQTMVRRTPPPLSVIPMGALLRSLWVAYVLSSPRLVNIAFPFMKRMSASKSWLLNPDRNPVLHALVRRLIYDQFCAGENEAELKKTIATIKKMGFNGVILGYAKEVVVDKTASTSDAVTAGEVQTRERSVEAWRVGTLRTLSMLGSGDFLAIKFTGAGPAAAEALINGGDMPPSMFQAMTEICTAAAKQNTRIWIDAEQQAFQKGIDRWTIDLMRRYNRSGTVLVYNTFQAYLKATSENIAGHLALAQKEEWALGVKLVRGAYIASEPRDLIHDTIEDTHAAYNSIVQSLLVRSFPGILSDAKFPTVQLFLASHNAESVERAYSLWRSRTEARLPTIKLEFGQIQGMADELGCTLVQKLKQQAIGSSPQLNDDSAPRAFKCLSWGSTQECMGNLTRRVTENSDALKRTQSWMAGLKTELWRRIKNPITFG